MRHEEPELHSVLRPSVLSQLKDSGFKSHLSCAVSALSCISLMTKDIEELFRCLFAIHIFSLVKYLFTSFTHFTNQVICILIIEFLKK